MTAFMRLDHAEDGIASGVVRGRIELSPADEFTSVDVARRKLPLELEPTATLAYMLEGAPVWDTELAGFLSPGRRSFGDGLMMTQAVPETIEEVRRILREQIAGRP